MSIEATLTLEEAARQCWDIVVAGAGPAGSFAAMLLARDGVRILLVDRATFPRWKVCGCCLSAAALGTLDAAGLGDLPQHDGAVPLRRVCLAARRRAALLPLPGGVALSREAFDAALLRAALADGVSFLPQTQARLLAEDTPADERRILLRQADREAVVTTRLLLAADGLSGGVLAGEPGRQSVRDDGSHIGAGAVADRVPAFFETGTIYMACGRGGYVGLVRLEDGRLDLAAALAPALVRHRGLAGAVAAVLGSVAWPVVPGLCDLPWRGTPALTRHAPRPAGQRYFILGDAAGYVEPFTGEGMAWALASAAALAPLARQAIQRWEPALIRRWQLLHRRLLGSRRRDCRLVARLLRHHRLTGGLVALLALLPSLASPLIRRLNRPIQL